MGRIVHTICLALPALACGWLALQGCSPDLGDGDADGDSDGDVDCTPDAISCEGNTARTCNHDGDGWSDSEDCGIRVCAASIGCATCRPAARQCQGMVVVQCNADGSAWDEVESCEDEGGCNDGYCGSPCTQAETNRSYEGCEYRAVTLMNSEVADDFTPAIVVGNRNAEAATVTVTRGGTAIGEATVAPNSTATIELPWVMDLKQEYPTEEDPTPEESTNVADGSYRVVSTLPVTVYQFNPLEYAIDRECNEADSDPLDQRCYSYSNDASLLLPVQVLSEHYLVMSYPNLAHSLHVVDPFWGDEYDYYSFSPSVMAVVNPNEQAVDVDITFSAPTQAGPGLSGYEAGDSDTFSIAPGGVLQIAARISESCEPDELDETYACGEYGDLECTDGYCDQRVYDLTGTEVSASAPVAVFGGHNCAFVPYDRWACDHLEEQLFPFETWGKHFLVSQARRENGEPDLIRVMSGADGNRITFTPESVHAAATLGRGEFVEFEARGAFEIRSDQPVLVGQFLVGQNYNEVTSEDLPPGDPSFSLAVPIEQYRSSYNFLAPSTYDRSYVNITVTEAGADSIELDGANLAGEAWETVAGTGYSTLRLEIDPGSHAIGSSAGSTFGIIVYGYGQYTSYMFPGGLNLEEIAVW
jgi:hypothetical protein